MDLQEQHGTRKTAFGWSFSRSGHGQSLAKSGDTSLSPDFDPISVWCHPGSPPTPREGYGHLPLASLPLSASLLLKLTLEGLL